MPDTHLPQGLCSCHALCMVHSFPDIPLAYSLTSFSSLSKHHLFNEVFLSHPITISPHPNALHNSALSSPQHLSPSNILYMFYLSCSLSVSSTLTHQKTKSIKSEIFDCSGYCSMSRAQRSPSTESALHRRCLKSLLRELKRLPLQWSITHPNYIGSTTIT